MSAGAPEDPAAGPPAEQGPAGVPRSAQGEEPDEPTWDQRSLWQLLPRKTLLKGFWLLLMLGGVLWFRARSPSCATTFLNLAPPEPVRAPARPAPEGRTVRMAPLPPAGQASGGASAGGAGASGRTVSP